ncbi:MAG: hypothetical protein ABI374_04010 [Ginsengibacter sp.]
MKNLFLAVLFLSVSGFSFAQDGPSATWAKNKVVVDGNANEWNLPLKNYDNTTGLFFDFENDSTHLYLCFQTKYEINESRIMRAGMKIILSNKINGKHKSVIIYPLPASKIPKQKDEIQPDPMAPHESRHAAFLEKDTLMEVKGFTTKNGMISTRDTAGIHAAINWDSAKVFTYEIAIPLKEMFGDNYDLKDLSKEISLDVVISATPADNVKNREEESDYSEREGSRTGGGRMGGQGGGQYQGNRQAMFPKTELKQKFVLANK